MTYTVSSGTLNPTQLNNSNLQPVSCKYNALPITPLHSVFCRSVLNVRRGNVNARNRAWSFPLRVSLKAWSHVGCVLQVPLERSLQQAVNMRILLVLIGWLYCVLGGWHFYRVTACNATHGIAIAILSVRLSVRCVYCDKTKWCTADILIQHRVRTPGHVPTGFFWVNPP